MLPFILLPLLLLWLQKYRVGVVFHAVDLLPLAVVEAIHLVFQISTLCGYYGFVGYAREMQIAFGLVLLLPILRRKLYVPALAGCGGMLFGTLLNRLVIAQNGGKMPVYPTLSALTGFCTKETLLAEPDSLHVLMTAATRWNFLGDYLDIGLCILSIGDVFIHAFVSVIIYYDIRALQPEKEVKQHG